MEPIKLFFEMLRIRRVEESLAMRYAEQEMRCPMHLCIGQESIAVGVSAALKRSDKVFSNHRAHGHYLAKGGSLQAMVAEMYGRTTGCCGGRGGSMHLIDLNVSFMGSTPIVGGTVPLAVGSAWTSKLCHTNDVTVVYFGDGCFEEGVVAESMNFAALHQLPVLFVCENNDFSVYTRRKDRQPEQAIYKIAQAHGISSACGDGNNVLSVIEMADKAIESMREDQGPQFLEFSTYRWREHCGPDFDHGLKYRTASEIQAGEETCPLLALRSATEIDANMLSQFELQIAEEIKEAFDFALASPMPNAEKAERDVYA
jgi:TPP-dependent pyruvate/acetoin dehydrogenase alpha subunit